MQEIERYETLYPIVRLFVRVGRTIVRLTLSLGIVRCIYRSRRPGQPGESTDAYSTHSLGGSGYDLVFVPTSLRNDRHDFGFSARRFGRKYVGHVAFAHEVALTRKHTSERI